jgi:hypothetical protein
LALQAVGLLKVPANLHGGRVDQEEATPNVVTAWQQACCGCCFWIANWLVVDVQS